MDEKCCEEKRPAIDLELQTLEEMINGLRSIVSRLEKRLEPVIDPRPTAQANECEVGSSKRIAVKLSILSTKLNRSIGDLSALYESLDV